MTRARRAKMADNEDAGEDEQDTEVIVVIAKILPFKQRVAVVVDEAAYPQSS